MRTLALLSDSTGDLGERFLRAMISQFPGEDLKFRVFSFVRDQDELNKIIDDLSESEPVLFHTTLDFAMKREIERFARQKRWPVYDLTGDAMTFLEKALGRKSVPSAARLHKINEAYDRRIEAIDFTVNHDDGLNTDNLRRADLVLIGVSRASKTPTSIFLANKGYKVANVPLVKGLPVPESLTRYRGLKIAGLMIAPEKLREIRMQRADQDRIPGTDYTNLDSIRAELDWAHSLMLELGCPVIDVTHLAVEETAAHVLKALHLR